MAYGTAPVYAEIMPLVMPSVSGFAAISVLGSCFLMPLLLGWFDLLFSVLGLPLLFSLFPLLCNLW
jgi:hypothetical protein